MKPAPPFRLFVPHSRTYLIALCISGCLQVLMGPSCLVAQKKAYAGFGLLAHWPFDENYSSSVNNDLYEGRPVGGAFTSIHKDRQVAKVGAGALRLDSGRASGQKTFVAVRNPLFGVRNSDVFTVVAWYRHEDLSNDGSDTRSFVWESTPGFSLAFGVREEEGRHDAEWWFQTASHAAISDASGPPIAQGQWVHVAMV